MSLPYIGITGIVSSADVAIAAECLPLVPRSHRLMAGVLVSAKTLRGERTANRRYPPFAEVEALLSALAAAGCWPVVHFNAREDLAFCLGALAATLPSMRGLQLNVVRPPPGLIEHFRKLRPDVEVIVQVNRGSVPELTPLAVIDCLITYGDVASYALLDFSGGEGKAFDAAFVAEVLKYNVWEAFNLGPAVAGGLGPGALAPIGALYDALGRGSWRVCGLSFDAETGVRVPAADARQGERGQDLLDRSKSLDYVRAVAGGLRGESR